MKRTLTTAAIGWVLAASLATSGCVQMPTEKRSVADMRPQLSFKAESPRAQAARVIVDDLDMGAVSDYLDGVAAVRVLPGTHQLRIVAGGEILLDEKVYLGDGVARAFIVK